MNRIPSDAAEAAAVSSITLNQQIAHVCFFPPSLDKPSFTLRLSSMFHPHAMVGRRTSTTQTDEYAAHLAGEK